MDRPLTHRCPVDGCEAVISRALVMCRLHWKVVPHALRTAVVEAGHALQQGARGAPVRYETARCAAIRAAIALAKPVAAPGV